MTVDTNQRLEAIVQETFDEIYEEALIPLTLGGCTVDETALKNILRSLVRKIQRPDTL